MLPIRSIHVLLFTVLAFQGSQSKKCDALTPYEPLVCFSIWAGKLNVFLLSQNRAVLFKAGCLCKCPLVAVHLNFVSQYTKAGGKATTDAG